MPTIPTETLGRARTVDEEARQRQAKIAALLESKREEIAKLESDRDAGALDVVLEITGAREQWDALDAKVTTARRELGLMQNAQAQAERAAERAAFERRRAERNDLRKRVAKLFAAQASDARAITDAIVALQTAMNRMQDRGARIAAASPSVPQGTGMLIFEKELQEAVGYEIWRVSYPPEGSLGNHNRIPPGAEYPGAILTGIKRGPPENTLLESLEDRVRISAKFLDDILAERRSYGGAPGPGADEPETDPLVDEKESV